VGERKEKDGPNVRRFLETRHHLGVQRNTEDCGNATLAKSQQHTKYREERESQTWGVGKKKKRKGKAETKTESAEEGTDKSFYLHPEDGGTRGE